MLAVKDIVAQNQANRRRLKKALAEEKGLGNACGLGLHGITQTQSETGTVPQQALILGQVQGRGNDQYFPDARQHKH